LGRFDDQYYVGRRPNGIYVPRFTNWGKDVLDVRGFGYQRCRKRSNGIEQTEKKPSSKLQTAMTNPARGI
jgi:hypothetical protein